MQFTNKFIQSLEPKSKRYDLQEIDGKGLAIRVLSSSQKSWGIIYHDASKKKWIPVGNYPEISLAKARKLHSQIWGRLVIDQNLATTQYPTPSETHPAITIQELINEYMEQRSKPRKQFQQSYEPILKKEVAPKWGQLSTKAVTPHDVTLLLDKMMDCGRPMLAQRTLYIVKRMFQFALETNRIEYNPCDSIKNPAKVNRPQRLLSLSEIKAFWHGLEKANLPRLSKLALKIQLLTAQRQSTVLSAQWNEIDLEAGWWTIPGNRVIHGLSHHVPLSKLCLSLLSELKNISGDSCWLFPSPKRNTFMGIIAIHRTFKKNTSHFDNMEPFTTHDLRGTVASQMMALGMPKLTIEKILNPSSEDSISIFSSLPTDDKKKQVLEKWAETIETIEALLKLPIQVTIHTKNQDNQEESVAYPPRS